MSITTDKITSNGEEFTRSDYNGVSIIIRNADGFINATKIAKDNGKRKNLDKYFKSDKWNEICKNFNPPKKIGGSENKLFYTINSIGKCETYGVYVHPKLVHFVAEWCNISYAFKVAVIMDNINTMKNAKKANGEVYLNEVIMKQEAEIKRLTEDIECKQKENSSLLAKVDELLKENKEQTKLMKKQSKKINYLVGINEDLKTCLIGNNGRLTGEEVKDSKILMMYLTKDKDNELYIKIVRSQVESLKGVTKQIYIDKKYLFLSYLPEAITQNKSVINTLISNNDYKGYIEVLSKGGITMLHINKDEYMRDRYTTIYKQFDETKVTRLMNTFIKYFISDYKRILAKQITNKVVMD